MRTIYFDLDGTLTNPKPGITRSIQYALGHLDRPIPSEDELTWCIGPPLHASFVTLLGSDELAHRGVALYRERFSDIGLYENEVYPGIEDVLNWLVESGRRLFVATSKPAVFADRIIDHFNLRRYFTRVFGSELDGTRTDKGELLAYALAASQANPTDALMIGDRSHDVVGARRNGIDAIGVLYGFGNQDELQRAGARHLCTTPAEIPGYIL